MVAPEDRDRDIIIAGEFESIEIRKLWKEYWDFAGLSPIFQNFAEELRNLPGPYAPPGGCLLLARVRGESAGTAAFLPLNARACEGKRLYVRPQHRGKGLGMALIERLIAEARSAGYEEMYGDTLPSMTSAMRLYRQAGFSEVGAYSAEPTPGARFLRLSL